MDQSARCGLPFLAPGQAQKEWFHNEALQRIDMLLCPVVEGPSCYSARQPGRWSLLHSRRRGNRRMGGTGRGNRGLLRWRVAVRHCG
jgi:hypothetical protein